MKEALCCNNYIYLMCIETPGYVSSHYNTDLVMKYMCVCLFVCLSAARSLRRSVGQSGNSFHPRRLKFGMEAKCVCVCVCVCVCLFVSVREQRCVFVFVPFGYKGT